MILSPPPNPIYDVHPSQLYNNPTSPPVGTSSSSYHAHRRYSMYNHDTEAAHQRTISMCIVIPNLIQCAYQLSNNKTNLSCRSAASYLNCVAVIGLPAAHNKLRHRRGVGDYYVSTSFIFSLSLFARSTTTKCMSHQAAAWLVCCNQTMLDRR